jgi:hypothetical protein
LRLADELTGGRIPEALPGFNLGEDTRQQIQQKRTNSSDYVINWAIV